MEVAVLAISSGHSFHSSDRAPIVLIPSSWSWQHGDESGLAGDCTINLPRVEGFPQLQAPRVPHWTATSTDLQWSMSTETFRGTAGSPGLAQRYARACRWLGKGQTIGSRGKGRRPEKDEELNCRRRWPILAVTPRCRQSVARRWAVGAHRGASKSQVFSSLENDRVGPRNLDGNATSYTAFFSMGIHDNGMFAGTGLGTL